MAEPKQKLYEILIQLGSYRMNYLNDSMSFNTNVMFTTIKLILFYLHLHNILPVVSQVGLIRACIS